MTLIVTLFSRDHRKLVGKYIERDSFNSMFIARKPAS